MQEKYDQRRVGGPGDIIKIMADRLEGPRVKLRSPRGAVIFCIVKGDSQAVT